METPTTLHSVNLALFKLIDFGISNYLNSKNYSVLDWACGTYGYIAP